MSSLIFRLVSFLVILGLATLGFQWARPEGDLTTLHDSIYRALQMFALNYEVEPGWSQPALLSWTRFFAAAFTVYALITLLTRRLSDWLRKGVHCLSGKRAVLLGYGQVNRMLAQAMLKQEHKLTIVDTQFTQADQNFARMHGIVLVEMDLSDPAALKKLWLHWAQRIYVACGTDTLNLKLGRKVADLAQRSGGKSAAPQIGVHIASPKFMYDLNSSEDVNLDIGRGISFFSLKSVIACVLMQRAQIVQRAQDLGCTRPHLVILGAGELAEAIMIDALLTGVSNQTIPRVTLIDCDAEGVRDRIIAHYPRLFDGSLPDEAQPQIEFAQGDVSTFNFQDSSLSDKFDTGPDPVTCWIFTCREDEDNLEAALRLQSAMHRLHLRPVPVFKRIWQGDIGLDKQRDTFLSDYFGQRSDPALAETILHPRPDWLAQRIHEKYEFDVKASNLARDEGFDSQRFLNHWQQLPVNGRRSNRLAGEHLPQKLSTLGFDWRGRTQGRIPLLPRKGEVFEAVDLLKQQDFERKEMQRRIDEGETGLEPIPPQPLPAALVSVAKDEHIRWMLDRVIDGWTGGRHPRSNRRRTHPNIRSFDALDTGTKRLDLSSLKAVFELEKPDLPHWAPTAYAPLVRADVTPHTLDGYKLPEGTTELVLHIIPDDPGVMTSGSATPEEKKKVNTLDAAQLEMLKKLLRGFRNDHPACRFHVIQYGATPFRVEMGPPGRDDPRGLNDWLGKAQAELSRGIQVDFTLRPDLDGPESTPLEFD